MSDTFPLAKKIGIVQPAANLDYRYGPWPTVQRALEVTAGLRELGLTVAVSSVSTGAIEYHFKNGITDNDLIIKSVDLSGYLPLSGGTLTGNISTNSIIYAKSGNSDLWNSGYNFLNSNSGLDLNSRTFVNNNSSKIIEVNSKVNLTSGSWDSVYSNVNGLSTNWNSVYSNVNLNSSKYESIYSFYNEQSSLDLESRTFVNNNSANINEVSTKVNNASGNWDSVYSTYNTNSSLYATKQYTADNFLALSGGYVSGDVSIGGNLFLLGSATQIATEDLVLSNSLIYLASGNPADIVDIGFVGYTSSFNLGQRYVGLIRDSFSKKWYLFSQLSSVSASDINVNDATLAIDTLKANIDGNLVTNTNVFGDLSAFGNILGNISYFNSGEYYGTLKLANNGVQLNIPRIGAANPTVTQDGDLWYRSNNLYYNNLGTIRAIAHTSSWSAMTIAEGQAGTATTSRFIAANTLGAIISAYAPTNAAFTEISTNLTTNSAAYLQGEPYTILNSNSGKYESVYGNVNGLSANWNSVFNSVNPVSANWNSVYTTSNTNSGKYESVYSNVNELSSNWNSVYGNVNGLSSNWSSVYNSITPVSANWNSVYNSVNPVSANWDSVYSNVNQLSTNWESVYNSVNPVSANWDSVYSNTNLNSGKYESVYSNVNGLSANWSRVFSTVNSNSAKYESVYSNVNGLSANWSRVFSTVNSNSAKYESVYSSWNSNSSLDLAARTFINQNSSNTINVNTKVNSSSANWDSIYSLANSVSGSWSSLGTLTTTIVTDLSVGAITAAQVIPAGTTFQQFAEALLTKIYYPTFTNRSLTVTSNHGGNGTNVEIGTQSVTLTLTYNRGQIRGKTVNSIWDPNFLQGYRTGVANDYIIFGNVTALNTATSANAIIIDGANTYNVTCNYAIGDQPVDSRNNPYLTPEPASSVSTSMTLNGRRRAFFGADTTTTAPTDSNGVRALPQNVLNPVINTVYTINVAAGARRVVFAYPATLRNVTQIYYPPLQSDVKSTFTLTTVSVSAANSLFPTNYKVYSYIPDIAFGSSTTYQVTI